MTRVADGGRRLHFLVAFALAFVAIQATLALQTPAPRQPDETFYLRTAHTLLETGVFSTPETRSPAGNTDGAPLPDNYIAPLYPGFLAGLAAISPAARTAIACAESGDIRDCRSSDFSTIFQAQAALAALGALGAFWGFLNLFGRPRPAYLALGLMLALGLQARLATMLLTDGAALAAMLVFFGAFTQAVRDGAGRWWAVAGGLLGLAALIRPSYSYLPVLLAPVVVLFLVRARSQPPRRAVGGAALLLAGALAVAAPWMARNAVQLGTPALTGHYSGNILGERLGYNAMTAREWAAAFVYWLPDFGDSLASRLFPPDAYRRLQIQAPDGFFVHGKDEILRRAKRDLGGPEGLTAHLVTEHLLAQPITHAVTTLPLIWRGLWVGDYFGLGAVLLAPFVIRLRRARGDAAPLLMAAAPFLLMAGFHALVSINIVRYNFPLAAIYAVLWTYALGWVRERAASARRGVRATPPEKGEDP